MTGSGAGDVRAGVTSQETTLTPTTRELGIDAFLARREAAEADSPGFLGSTSFVATIQAGPDTEDLPGINKSIGDDMTPAGDVDRKSLDLGLKVLTRIPTRELCIAFLEYYLVTYAQKGFPKPCIKISMQQFWATFGSRFREPRKVTDLEMTAMQISRNGSRPVERPDDATEWVAAFSGANTRWETLGILFVGFAVACIAIPEPELRMLCGGPDVNRPKLIAEMKECAEACIELSRHSLNNVVCNLLYKHTMLETVIAGDTGRSSMFKYLREFSD